MSENNRSYTNQDIIDGAKEVYSTAGLLRKLGLKPAGGNYYIIKKWLQVLDVDISHWTKQAWNRGEQLKDWNDRIKPHVIKKRGHKCEKCNRKTWLGEKIPLELHHKDFNRTNNEEDNLELLCPNCHSLLEVVIVTEKQNLYYGE